MHGAGGRRQVDRLARLAGHDAHGAVLRFEPGVARRPVALGGERLQRDAQAELVEA